MKNMNAEIFIPIAIIGVLIMMNTSSRDEKVVEPVEMDDFDLQSLATYEGTPLRKPNTEELGLIEKLRALTPGHLKITRAGKIYIHNMNNVAEDPRGGLTFFEILGTVLENGHKWFHATSAMYEEAKKHMSEQKLEQKELTGRPLDILEAKWDNFMDVHFVDHKFSIFDRYIRDVEDYMYELTKPQYDEVEKMEFRPFKRVLNQADRAELISQLSEFQKRLRSLNSKFYMLRNKVERLMRQYPKASPFGHE